MICSTSDGEVFKLLVDIFLVPIGRNPVRVDGRTRVVSKAGYVSGRQSGADVH